MTRSPGANFRNTAAGGYNSSSQFMAEDLWRVDIALEDFFDVGSADATRRDFDKNFVRVNFGTGTCSTRTTPLSRYTPARMDLESGRGSGRIQ